MIDSTDIDTDALYKIFIKPETFSQKCIEAIIDWNESYDPSFGMVKNQLKKFLSQNQDYPPIAMVDVLKTIRMLMGEKCPRNFLRAYLATVKAIMETPQDTNAKQVLKSKIDYYQSNWKSVPLEILEPYFDAFSLKTKINQPEINQFIDELIQKKKYNNCLEFIKFLGVGENYNNIGKLVGKMTNKRDASKAADYVKNLKLNPNDYPVLGERLYKNTARHFLRKEGWQYAEEVFQDSPEALACVVEDLIYKKKDKQALSIMSRHDLEKYLQKQESKEFFRSHQKPQQLVQNRLHKDYFGPSDKTREFSLIEDFGIKQTDVVWIDSESKQLEKAMMEIQSAEVLGIDTESIVGQTKFTQESGAALIQVATDKTIYLIDGFNAKSKVIAETFKTALSKAIIIGHSFTNDAEVMAKAFGFQSFQELKIVNMIDLCKIYKAMNPESRYSSLAHICKQVLGKQLCKTQTLTNWRRRPLRSNQIHYAGLDAYILIKIYEKLKEEYGQMFNYYADLDNDSF